MIGFGFFEMFLIMVLGGLFGVPLSVPPGEPDPYLSRIAPADPIYYTQWSGVALPKGNVADEGNSTLQLLMEPEVQSLISKADVMYQALIARMATVGSPEDRIAGPLFSRVVRQMLLRPACAYVTDVELAEQGLTGEAVLLIDVSGDRAGIEELLDQYVNQVITVEGGAQVEQVRIEGHTLYRVLFNPAAPELFIGFHDKYLFVGVGEQALPSLLARGKQEPPAWLVQMQTDLAVDHRSTMAYVNVAKLQARVNPLLGFIPEMQNIVNEMGLENVRTYRCVAGLHEDGYAIRTHLATDGELKLLSFFSPSPITEDDLRRVPANTPAALSIKLDALAIGEILAPLIGINQFEVITAELSDEMSRTLGVGLEELFTDVLGDTATVYAAPEDGGLVSGWVAFVPVIESGRAKEILDNAMELIERQSFGQLEPVVSQVDGATMYTIETMPDAPFRFAILITDTELVASVLPQAAIAHIRRPAGVPSLADNPLVASAYSADDMQGGGLRMVLHIDHSEIIRLAYPFFTLFAQQSIDEIELPEEVEFSVMDFPSVGALTRHTQPSTIILYRDSDGYRWEVRQTIPTGDLVATLPVAAMAYLPALSAAQAAAGRTTSSNNLKQIALSLHLFHDVHGRFPARANTNERGKDLLSWRVHILPYIEQQNLYEQFHLDEPWDSEHNRALIDQMPAIFARPGTDPSEGLTNYLGNAAERGLFRPADGQRAGITGVGMREILDGTSNTIMVVEVNDENRVIWTQPADFDGIGMNTLERLIGSWKGGFLAAFGDGSVQFLRDDLEEEQLEILFDRADGRVIDFNLNR